MLTVIDEYTHECLAIRTKRQLNSTDVLDCLNDLFAERGAPEHIRFLIEWWRNHYNQVRPYSSLNYRSPAPQAVMIETKSPRLVMPTHQGVQQSIKPKF